MIHRKTGDDNAILNRSPYKRDSELYMSQPMLVLSNSTTTQPDIDADDMSDQSASPDRSSSTHAINRYPAPLQHRFLGHARKHSAPLTVSNSSNFPIRDGFGRTQPKNNAGTTNIYPTPRASDEFPSNSLRPGWVGLSKPPLPKPPKVKAVERLSPRLLPPIPTVPPLLPLLSSASREDIVSSHVQIATSAPKANKLYASPDRPVLLMYSSTPALPTTVSSDGPNDSGRASDIPPALPTLEECSSSVPDRRERVGPKLSLNTTLDINNVSNNSDASTAINTSSTQQPLFPPIQPRRTVSSAPRHSLPPANYRFSLNLVDGHSARLSPSVILRPPPLPLLNLPVLSGSTSDESSTSSGRSKRAGLMLMSMPALPCRGSSRGAAAHEEIDEGEGDDDEEEDGDGDDDDDNVTPDSTPPEIEVDTPHSGYSSTSETVSGSRSHSRTSSSASVSSYETARAEPSTPPENKFSRAPHLPPSRIDLSFLNSPPLDNKGKGRSKELTEDAGRTPIATRRRIGDGGTASNNTPFAFNRMDFLNPEKTATDTWAVSPVITKGGQPRSPTLTPRPGGHFMFPLPPLPALPVPSPPSPMPTLSTTDNRLTQSINTITQFPGAYKRASRSLVDVYALEKKKNIEQMVREEEESAEEERKRRVKSMRISMRAMAATTFDQQLNGDEVGDGQLKTSLLSAVSMRKSLAPHWIEWDTGDDNDPANASGEASPATEKHPKRTSNRISMAPAYDTIIPLRRRLSMPTFNSASTAPPPYPDLFLGHAQTHGVKFTQIQPRDDEGQEKLPAYSNSIYLKAIMPRKVEFSGPGVQAKDRKWKRVLCVLEGTSFKIYKPPGVSAIGEWWESKVGIGDMAVPAMTTGSFNSGSGGQRLESEGAGAAGVIGQSKGEADRGRLRKGMMGIWLVPPQIDGSNQRQGPSFGRSDPSSATPNSSSNAHPTSTSNASATKSVLNRAVHLLSSRGHGRSVSDVGLPSNTPPVPRSSRSSLNMPMNGSTPTIASTSTSGTSDSTGRSTSPMFASSTALLTSSSSHRSENSPPLSMSGGGGGSVTAWTVINNYPAAASSSSTSKGKKKVEDFDPLLADENNLIKAYTMQQAESGLGTDYLKRKHVIRVRMEGEQFLLQAHNVDSVIDWIEGLQAATNIALDLDERVMPRGPLFPRRRRRRRVPAPVDVGGGIPATQLLSATGNTPVDALPLVI